jgi:MFS family permease
VIAAFSVAFAAGLITAGRLGDILGRRGIFAAGMGLFTLSSTHAGWPRPP